MRSDLQKVDLILRLVSDTGIDISSGQEAVCKASALMLGLR